MKAYLILCILLASLLFFPSSLLARELAGDAGKGSVGGTGDARPPNPCVRRHCPPPNSGP
ncbi:hypothetical protein TIFTF001_026777 [Ficus carica]|uniref:Uncharacterized protein n=1 Tax=Ficus carica TaxID=3494 RepID=A0AA88DLR6_FICCA|nr:hypothetical protein TIFTF001_026777 [Ficus carica]